MTSNEAAALAVAGPQSYHSLYVSPYPDDALFACVGRMLAERAEGHRVLVAVVFASQPEGTELEHALSQMGVVAGYLGLEGARQRSDYYRRYSAALFGRHPEDERVLSELTTRLSDLVLQTRVRRIYFPLGAGSHVDHRLCHEAGARVFDELIGRDVYLYEERPEALLPGAIRMRLAELGARLPPAASEIHDDSSLLRVVSNFCAAAHVRQSVSSLSESLRCAQRLASRWRAARAWHPLRAYGVRLQPMIESPDDASTFGGLVLLSSCANVVRCVYGGEQRLAASLRSYARRQGSFDYVERYWLMLPQRDAGGLARVPLGDSVGVT
jgi:LmbE family N-acetylglucosaminyl deacetylase